MKYHLGKLYAFKEIVESGKIREAAKRLNITQPALTRLVQSLEQASKSSLLVRNQSGVRPTESGMHLYKYSVSILSQLEDIEEKVRNPTDEDLSGHLKIGSYTSLAEYLWPKLIVKIRKEAPRLKISIKTDQKIARGKALEMGLIDVIVDAEPTLADIFLSWKIYEDLFAFYAHPALDISNVDSLSIIYCGSAYDENKISISSHLEHSGVRFSGYIDLDSFPAVSEFARNKVGVAVLPKRLAERSVREKKLSQIKVGKIPRRGFGNHAICMSILSERKDDPKIVFLKRSLQLHFSKNSTRA